MDNEMQAIAYRQSLHSSVDAKSLPPCQTCDLVFVSFKQYLLHIARSSCSPSDTDQSDMIKTFQPDFQRWKKEDEQRLAVGQRIYKRMSKDEVGSSRPQTDFIQEINKKIEEKFKLDDEYLANSRLWINSEEAKKISDRLEKHLREAKGNIVCKRCQVACRSDDHFILHLMTYDHRLKSKGDAMELPSLLIGNFHKAKYLLIPDQSELDEDTEVNSSPSPSLTVTIADPNTVTIIPNISMNSLEETLNEAARPNGGGGGGKCNTAMKNFLITD
ncbi:hypothetical protein PFISCL1PPCAC_23897 [Pristionchus fissidentatus]|uniref:C2H2-type domain-containing protein n=1 Tax=Pristionchus fissidentatus TaxID=1538716 RepID=A0AAV5WLW8_9BILA|nr:hypothetical protein PFISCL1PPCAC_23897 [Pristionchus fissidentatus]